MIAFIAWTPLHIINIINTKQSYYNNKEADLYIYDEFSGAKEIYQNILKEDIFQNIYLIDHKKIGNKVISKLNVLLNINRMVKIDKKLNYEEIFTQGGNYFLKILYGQTKKNNPNVKLNYIEDGLATYLNLSLLNISEKRKKIMNRLNPYSIFLAEIKNYYLYNPSLTNIEQGLHLKKLPVIKQGTKTHEVLKRIFNLSINKKSMENTVLFLDQPLQSDGYSINEDLVLDYIKDCTPDKDIIVKLHPRTHIDRYGKDIKVLQTNLPLELCFLAYNLKDTIIISCLSTAAFTPQMIFGLDNKVILLSDMISKNKQLSTEDTKTQNVLNSITEFYEKYKQTGYDNVEMPKDVNELKNILRGE